MYYIHGFLDFSRPSVSSTEFCFLWAMHFRKKKIIIFNELLQGKSLKLCCTQKYIRLVILSKKQVRTKLNNNNWFALYC